jgi:hypothetical protein
MNLGPLALPVLLALGAAAVFGLDRLVRWMQRRGWIDLGHERPRRGVGHAMLGLQEFVDPGVEHVLAAENREQKDDADHPGDEDDPDLLRADLAASLGRSPIDTEEVRRHLAAARRAGLDWRALFDEAVHAELAARPYRAPSLPPIGRVAPRE